MTPPDPIVLWTLLAAGAVAAPLVVHRIRQHRRRRSCWAAMELLQRALENHARELRREKRVLLALRVLAVLLLLLGLEGLGERGGLGGPAVGVDTRTGPRGTP